MHWFPEDTGCNKIQAIQGAPEFKGKRVYQNSGDTECTRIKGIQGASEFKG